MQLSLFVAMPLMPLAIDFTPDTVQVRDKSDRYIARVVATSYCRGVDEADPEIAFAGAENRYEAGRILQSVGVTAGMTSDRVLDLVEEHLTVAELRSVHSLLFSRPEIDHVD